MKPKNKKAQLEHKLVSIILIALTLLILIGVIQRGFSKFQGKDAEIICQESIAARATTAIQAGGAELKTLPKLCQTVDKDISGDEEEVKEQVAWLASRCWWMFGEGRYEEVIGENWYQVFGFRREENACFLCYAAVVPDEGVSISKVELLRYLSRTPHPRVPDTTYLQYLQGQGSETGGPGNVVVASDIESGGAYGILFVSKATEASGPFGAVQGLIADAGEELGAYYQTVNTQTSSILVDNLNAIEQYGCES
ncbi:hypothetical protein HYS49_03155, partial [Candidatus Woesearchaeota archaeon]|nr:hypothetical protein [Candidatus Woesearchaeota archaeon]